MRGGVRTKPWEDPEAVGYRREPVSTLRRAAWPGALDLDGTWRFQLLPSPDAEPGPAWRTATVPGCWTTEPAEAAAIDGEPDLPWYTNVEMPWPDLPPRPPAANPTGVYEREVDVPAGWAGRRVLLHVGAAESLLVAHVDGVCVGVSTDSHLAAEFDVTHVLPPGSRGTVRLTVVKWSAGTFAEDQDQWWHGGVTRSVRVFSRPRLHLSDVRATAGLAGTTGRLAVDVRVGCDGEDGPGLLPAGWRVAVHLDGVEAAFDRAAHERDRADERLSVFRGRARFTLDVPGVRPWSAEEPHLSDLTVTLLDPSGAVVETARQRVGFRTVRIVGPDLLVNGRRVFIRGANRHDRHPLTGRVVTEADLRADLVTLKRFGFNAVRTSHYPNDPAFLDLTDELGFYVVDEADVETHAYAHELCDDVAYLPAFTQRVARMVRRDRGHASVICWSLGNESDYGANHDAVAAWVRRDDPTRPVQYEGAIKDDWDGGHAASDVVCPMYASIDQLIEHVTRRPPTRPVILCEYSHAMGNSNGSLADYWDAIERLPGLQGGFVWELADHGVLQRADGMPAGRAGAGLFTAGVPKAGLRWAHGGDFGDLPNDGAFCLDGLLLPDGTPKPGMLEHRELAAPVRMTLESVAAEGVRVRLRNHREVRDLGGLAAVWWVSGADGSVREAPATLPELRPGEDACVDVPAEVLAGRSDVERSVVLAVVTDRDEPWAPAGTTVCLPYVVLPPARPVAVPRRGGAAPPVDDEGRLVVDGLVAGPALALWRAPTDNDLIGGQAERWAGLGLDRLTGELVEVRREPGETVVVHRWRTAAGYVVHEQRFAAADDGDASRTWRCEDLVVLPQGLTDLPRIGVVLETVPGLTTAEWFGHGPWEAYPDRRTAPVAWHRLDLDALATPYVRPQENGGRAGVRRLDLTGPGRGLRVRFERPAQVSVLRAGVRELVEADRPENVRPRPGPVLHLDYAHRGLGTASCGPDTLPRYRTAAGVHTWTWWLSTWTPDPE